MISSFHLFMALSVVTLNCNGIRDTSRRAGLLHWVRSLPMKPDIICLQEVHCSSVQECSSWFLSSGFGAVFSPGSVRSSGCDILFRPSLSLSGSWCDTEGRYLQCEFSFRISPSVFAVCMSQIVILPGINIWTIFRRKSTFLFPLCCAATLTRFSTELWIGVALTRKVNFFSRT